MFSRRNYAASQEADVVGVLAAHRLWRETAGRDGRSAEMTARDLRGLDLAGADLRHASLRGCNLSGMSLAGTNFEKADLDGADLSGSNFNDANLKDARLFNSVLEGADLGGARHLKAAQLRGCDLSYATLPPHIDFYGLEQANQSLGRLAMQFVSTLTVCVYSWLVIGSTTDANLVTNASSVSVPFIDLSLPILGFYLLVPLAIAALSTGFYAHLQTFWDNVSSLPAFFPDGCELTARTPPTLLDQLIERHMTLLRRKKATPASRLYAALISVGMFGVVPATLFLFWLRYLPRHDAFGTALQLILLLTSLVFSWTLTVSMKAKLRLIPVRTLFARSWYQVLFAIVTCSLLTWISVQVLYGPKMATGLFYAELGGQRLAAQTGSVNLAGMNLRHANFAGTLAENADFSRAQLEQGMLDGAILRKTFLRDADLSRARLGRAQLEGADLRRARLDGATLSNADLRNTNLTQADLRRANLAGSAVAHANFSRANLTGGTNAHGIAGEAVSFALAQMEGAQLSRAALPKGNFFLSDLRNAYFWHASLPGASFILADLAGANFTQADLAGADLSQASLRGAVLDRAKLGNAKLVCAQLYDAVLSDADLTGADLQSAQLRGAVLRGARMARAQLGDASLEAADLRGVDLSQTAGLVRGQLAHAIVDESTILPRDLRP